MPLDALYSYVLALDEAQWQEKSHPRDKSGQFAKTASSGGSAKKGQVSNSVAVPLAAHGFKMQAGGEATYSHPSGHEIHIQPVPEGLKYSSHWHDPKSGAKGSGGVSLKQHLTSLGTEAAQTTPKAKQPKVAPTFEHPNANYAAQISKFGGVPVKETETSQHYKFPNGTLLAIKKKPSSMYSSLMKWAMTKPDGQIEKWKGHAYLGTALLKAEGTPVETTAQPSGTAAYKKAAEKVTAAGFKSTGSNTTVNGKSGYDRYILGSEEDLKASVSIHPETGAFRVWKAGSTLADKPGAEMVGTGYAITGTVEQFDAAFEALHPRGPGGQFLKKPGEVLTPGKHQTLIDILDSAGAVSESSPNDPVAEFKIGDNITVKVGKLSGSAVVYQDSKLVGNSPGYAPSDLGTVLTKIGAAAAAAQPPPVAKPPVAISSLNKIGPQLGSNPGGQYEDLITGQRYYVKQTQSEDHAKNENLAAALYQLAGTNTLAYRKSDDPKAVVTEMSELAANNVSQLTPDQRKRARVDFATHAWLANWDAAGLTGDNVGVIKGAPGQPDRVATLDVGGALAYRAKGSPKAHLFGGEVTEWNTLRDAVKNPTSAALFKDMTQDELKASVAKVAAVKPPQIRQAVKDAGYEGFAVDQLYDKLVARREDLIKRLNQEVNKPAAPPAPPPFEPPFDKPAYDPEEAKALTAAMPVPTPDEKKAVHNYTNGFYDSMNEAMRFGYHAGPKSDINHLVAYLDKASLPHDVVVSRKVKGSYAEFLKAQASHAGAEMTEYACASTSIDPQKWSGSVQMILKIPKGSKAAYVDSISANQGEREMLLQRGARYKVVAYHKTGPQGLPRIYCEVVWDK